MDYVSCSLCRTELKGNLRHPGLPLFITSVVVLMGIKTASFHFSFIDGKVSIFIFMSYSSIHIFI